MMQSSMVIDNDENDSGDCDLTEVLDNLRAKLKNSMDSSLKMIKENTMPTVAQELPEEGELDPTLDYDNYKFVSIDDVSKMLSQKHRQKVDNIVEHYDNLVKRTSSINLLLEDDYNAINVRTTALKKSITEMEETLKSNIKKHFDDLKEILPFINYEGLEKVLNDNKEQKKQEEKLNTLKKKLNKKQSKTLLKTIVEDREKVANEN